MALPPGLNGYLAGQEAGNRNTASNLNSLQGILGMQNMLRQQAFEDQLKPLHIQQMQEAVQQAAQKRAALQAFISRTQGGQQQAAVEGMNQGAQVGDVGPTVTNAARAPSGGILGYNPADLVPLKATGTDTTDYLKIWEAMNPPSQIHNGYAFNPRQLQHGQAVPSMQVTPQGQAVQTTIGPGGLPQISPMAGSLDTFRAFEGVKAGMDPFLGELDAQGRPIPQTKAGFAERYGSGSGAPALPQLGSPSPASLPQLRTSAPTAQDALRMVQEADARGQQASVTAPGQPPALPGERRGMGLSAAETAANTATASGRAKSGVDFENTVLENGRKAQDSLATLQVIAPNLEKLPTGPMYPTLVNAKAYLQQFGLAVDPNLGPAQATKAILNGLALQARNPSGGAGMPGAMSDPDRRFLVEMVPGLDKLPEGNKILLDTMMRLEQRKMDEASIVSRMQRDGKSSNDIRDALTQYSTARPMFPDYSKRFGAAR